MDAGRYLVEFERIGRNKAVRPITVVVDGEADLARAIRQHARHHLRSRDFDVMIDADAGAGWIACGMHSGGNFSITKRAPEPVDYGPAMSARHGPSSGVNDDAHVDNVANAQPLDVFLIP